jgi:hypothetical protein
VFWLLLSAVVLLLVLSRAFRLLVAWSAVAFVTIGACGVAIWYWRGAEQLKSRDSIRLAEQSKSADAAPVAEHLKQCSPEPGDSAASPQTSARIACNAFDQVRATCPAAAQTPGAPPEQLACQLDPSTAGSQ